MDAPAPYFHWGFILISVPNLVLIGVMPALFVIALVAPFPSHGARRDDHVGSWVYVFGVVTIASLVWVLLSGTVLAFMGSAWWHVSGVGRFFNSLHFWSVQMFFIFMVLHLWGQYWAVGWRDGRARTRMVGVVIFLISVVTAFTGYLVQQNFDSQPVHRLIWRRYYASRRAATMPMSARE
jgi:hypothetical protein